MRTETATKGLTVDAVIIDDGLVPLNPPSSVIEMSNLLGSIIFRNSKNQRWAKQAYCLYFHANPRTVQRQLQWLEEVGAISSDPINRVYLQMPWKGHAESRGVAPVVGTVSPLSSSGSSSISQSISTTKQSNKSINKEQTQKLIDTWNKHKPATWTALKSWNPKRQKVVDALYQGQGGMTQFIADIPTVFAGLQFIAKKTPTSRSFWLDPEQKQHHNFDAFMGTGQKLPKGNWHKSLEAAPDVPDAVDSLVPEIEKIWRKHVLDGHIQTHVRMQFTLYGEELSKKERWNAETEAKSHAEAWQHFYGTEFTGSMTYG